MTPVCKGVCRARLPDQRALKAADLLPCSLSGYHSNYWEMQKPLSRANLLATCFTLQEAIPTGFAVLTDDKTITAAGCSGARL